MWRCDCIGIAKRLGGDPILAIRAMKVATEHSKAHGQRSRQCMEKRFLLDWIELKSAHVTMRHQELSVSIESDTANSVESVEDKTTMPACEATQPAVFQTLVKFALSGEGLQDCLEGRRCSAHRICFPNAERINSIPKCAVLFCTSRMGLISVISNETIFLVSAIISIARCASR